MEIQTITTPNYATITLPPMFPASVSIRAATIYLNADGSWEGDADAFLLALKDMQQDGSVTTMSILWLIANAIRGSKQG